MQQLELILLFFTIAAVYASAGFGGGSSYLAIMALFGIEMTTMKSTALMCNLMVVSGGTYIFWQNGFLDFKKILPLSIVSVPLAFWGGTMKLSEKTFFILLSISLILAAVLMFLQKNTSKEAEKAQDSVLLSSSIGGGIGFLSGMVGIGGGIFLSPIFNLLKWDTPKHIAATASFYILINSVAGLAGQLSQNKWTFDWHFALPLLGAVLIGGQLGSRFSALKLNQTAVRQATAVLVLYVGANILWTHLYK